MNTRNIHKSKRNNEEGNEKREYNNAESLSKTTILGVAITQANKQEILEYISDKITTESAKFYIITPNPEIIVYAQQHKEFLSVLNQAQISLCDGAGIKWAGKVLQREIVERIP